MSERLVVETEEQAREAFEKYCSSDKSWLVTDFSRDKDGDYSNKSTAICWHFWGAAWKELASQAQESRGEEIWEGQGYMAWNDSADGLTFVPYSNKYWDRLPMKQSLHATIALPPVPQTVNVEEESNENVVH